MQYARKYDIAIVGATGNTGRKTLEILAERNFPTSNIIVIASDRSLNSKVSYRDKTLETVSFSSVDFSKVQLAFFCAGGVFSKNHAEEVARRGCVVIDKTSHFRLNPKVPLVIPEVNVAALNKGAPLGIVSAPNCIAIPLVMTLKALSEVSPMKRVIVSTYQSVSGAGRQGVDELFSQTKNVLSSFDITSQFFPKQIAFNVIPAIGDTLPSGSCEEEEKIISEVCKIMKSDIRVAATCVRVPVFVGHCMSVVCEFSRPVSEENVYDAFENFNGTIAVDRRGKDREFMTPIDAQGEDAVYVSRIRRDNTVKNGIMFWIAADNLRKGAALNSVQIAEEMINIDPLLTIFKRKKA